MYTTNRKKRQSVAGSKQALLNLQTRPRTTPATAYVATQAARVRHITPRLRTLTHDHTHGQPQRPYQMSHAHNYSHHTSRTGCHNCRTSIAMAGKTTQTTFFVHGQPCNHNMQGSRMHALHCMAPSAGATVQCTCATGAPRQRCVTLTCGIGPAAGASPMGTGQYLCDRSSLTLVHS